MTTTDRRDADTATVERMARAMHEVPAQPGVYCRIPWDRLMESHRDAYRAMVRAALSVYERAPGTDSSGQAVQRVLDLADELDRTFTGSSIPNEIRAAVAGPQCARGEGQQ